ncbi:hypothetical protein ACE193_05150 [Bernardetia sp. OM2101]|uniref:hypothetical protein n=1 Tax=Bernardetia sp. OM2101 TaxID=3344876 RepID=UPI0035CF4626
MNKNILDDDFPSFQEGKDKEIKARRRKLLPIWIKVFIWIFMIIGFFAPLSIVAGLFGYSFSLSIYSLETVSPISLLGGFIILLIFYKGVIAFGLWTEKKWAVDLALIDAIIGIGVCAFVMMSDLFFREGGMKLNIRLELILLIPYFLKMYKIKTEWEEREAK